MEKLTRDDYKAILDLVSCLVKVKSISAFAEMITNSKELLGFHSLTMAEMYFHKTCTHRIMFTDDAWMQALDSYVVSAEQYKNDPVFGLITSGQEVIKVNSMPDFFSDINPNQPLKRHPEENPFVSMHILSRMNKETNTANLIKLVCTTEEGSAKIDEMAGYLHAHLMSAYVRIMSVSTEYQERLSERELSVLIWLKHGKTSWEVSKILNITENTVNFHIKNIKRKLHASNRQHAVAIAIAKGIVD
jgi:LuxR family transcriptional activator of bioluminescence operon